MSQQILQLGFIIVEVTNILRGHGLSTKFFLADTVSRLNLGNVYYHRSVVECHPNLMLNFSYLKDLDEVDIFNISGLDG